MLALPVAALAAPSDWLVPGNGFEATAEVHGVSAGVCRLPDGRILTATARELRVSDDLLKPASATIPVADLEQAAPGLRLVRIGVATTGTWIAILRAPWTPTELRDFWDHRTRDYAPGLTGGQLFATRSADGGRTWSKAVMISDPALTIGFPPRNIVETPNRVLLLLAQYRTPHPGRHVVAVLRSRDDGRTWQEVPKRFDLPNSNGNHDGLIEPEMIQLRDPAKTAWIIFRTNLGAFWESRSTDDGATWSKLAPTKIRGSASPGTLLRLSDGRLVYVWNPYIDSARDLPPLLGGADANQRSLAVASWERRELILATSRDEGATWSAPIRVARYAGSAPGSASASWIAYCDLWEDHGFLYLHTANGNVNGRAPLGALP